LFLSFNLFNQYGLAKFMIVINVDNNLICFLDHPSGSFLYRSDQIDKGGAELYRQTSNRPEATGCL
jgi:hypothetical protein